MKVGRDEMQLSKILRSIQRGATWKNAEEKREEKKRAFKVKISA